MNVVVLSTVGTAGTALRAKPAYSAQVLATEPAGAILRVTEDSQADVRARIGKKNEWIQVRDNQGRRGYIMAVFVAEK
jgi:hypothetical protein